MAEIVEFESVHEFDLLKIGIAIDVTLSSGSHSIDLEARVDTGSSFCIFERYYAERLDLETETGIPIMIGTATGSFRAFAHEITLTVLGIELYSTVYFAESELFDRNVLGRNGWLNKVKLGLIEPEGKLYLSHYRT